MGHICGTCHLEHQVPMGQAFHGYFAECFDAMERERSRKNHDVSMHVGKISVLKNAAKKLHEFYCHHSCKSDQDKFAPKVVHTKECKEYQDLLR